LVFNLSEKTVDLIDALLEIVNLLQGRPELTSSCQATDVPAEMLAHFEQGFMVSELFAMPLQVQFGNPMLFCN
jgi:hypothetical protein